MLFSIPNGSRWRPVEHGRPPPPIRTDRQPPPLERWRRIVQSDFQSIAYVASRAVPLASAWDYLIAPANFGLAQLLALLPALALASCCTRRVGQGLAGAIGTSATRTVSTSPSSRWGHLSSRRHSRSPPAWGCDRCW